MKNWGTVLWLVVLLALTVMAIGAVSCDDDDDDDDDNDDTAGDDDDGRIDDVPDDVNDFLDSSDIEKLKAAGMPIYTGDNPPNIEGSYLLNTLTIIYDEIGLEGMTVAQYTVTYFDQTENGGVKQNYEAPDVGDTANGLGAFISGDGDCFTVFVDTTGMVSGCDYKLPAIHSACLTGSGMTDYFWGVLMKEKVGTGCDALIPVDAARVLEEIDGVAEEI
jgi:hypothetical protein